MKYVFEVDQLTVNYEKTPALWDVSFKVPEGKLVGIAGPNGAGKSTLIKAALGLVPSISGAIQFFGERRLDKKKIGYVPQCQSVDWDFPITVYDLVMMGRYGKMRFFQRPSAKDHKAVRACLKRVGLDGLERRQISQLSCGQQERAFIARALVQEADLYFMDEPFAGIDAASSQVICEILFELRDQGKSVFVVHHGLEEIQEKFDWVILLNRRLVACGPAAEVVTKENIRHAYGQENLLLEEVSKLSEEKTAGFAT